MPVSKNSRKKTRKPAKSSSKAEVVLAGRNSLEKMMGELTRGLLPPQLSGDDPFGGAEDDPLWEAQNIMYDAWEAGAKRARISLARQALAISDLCADAYVLLANEAAKNVMEKKAYLEQAVAAGERAIGPQAMVEDVGHFWGILETRPYMRARCDLAQCLWGLGDREAASGHLLDLLRLNPNDNQGVRYTLISWSLTLGDLRAVEKLLKAYPEDSAWMTYSHALFLFKRHGPSAAATKSLQEAVKANRHVADILLRAKRMPATLPDYYSPGSKEEAMIYLYDNRENWATEKGALEWLGEAMLK